MTNQPHLAPCPEELEGPVKAWSQSLVLPTYEPAPADRNPMFLDKRVFQGSSGRIYPLPFIDRIDSEPVDRAWDAVFIENEYLRVIILPELGGRIYAAIDKLNGYDCIYRNPVIKPALVGLAGPWISGGIEFNWPQHHRPSTYMPADWSIETDPDGTCTVWLGEHEPMNRMKGMHGVQLRPGVARFDTVVRLFNRTPLTQTVMWWANAATEVNEHYQSFFPSDVLRVADHAKRDMISFPHCSGQYYGVNYGERAVTGVPEAELPEQFVPQGDYAPDDLRWYANIPVPTSYMCVDTNGAFFGGYDHSAKAGLVHVADRHKSPGKKQWTWGNHAFGYAWDRNLTDPNKDGVYPPYIELMAGVYTDNQPDFSFIGPGETKTFTQHWYPIRDIGVPDIASPEMAIKLTLEGAKANISVLAVEPLVDIRIVLAANGKELDTRVVSVAPNAPLIFDVAVDDGLEKDAIDLSVLALDGRVLLQLNDEDDASDEPTESATEPLEPHEIASVDELYITGLHLGQYRHATRTPEAYWQEALKRDPQDSRCNNAMGLWHLRRGEFELAETFFRVALKRLRRRNPNPYDGEVFYNLGIALRLMGKDQQAYKQFSKAAWNAAWIAPSHQALAEIDACRGAWGKALVHAEEALRYGAENLQVRALKAFCLRALGRSEEADALFKETLTLDPFDFLARDALGQSLSVDPQVLLDLALDYARMGNMQRALDVLQKTAAPAFSGAEPLRHYYAAYFADQLGLADVAIQHRSAAKATDSAYCFPSRIEEIAILRAAMSADSTDAMAPYYLGNLFYDKKRHEEAIALWERSCELAPEFSIVWRNLGIGYQNIKCDPDRALKAYDHACAYAPQDARVFYERDQLCKRIGMAPQGRHADLTARLDLVGQRDDLCIELATLHNQLDAPEQALELLLARNFQPWEGGEGLVLGQYERTCLKLGEKALAHGKAVDASRAFEAALKPPQNLGEAAHMLANQSDVHYWRGIAFAATGDQKLAEESWQAAANFRGDFLGMEVRSFSEKTYFTILSMKMLGRNEEAIALCDGLEAFATEQLKSKAKIDYFATSLPTMLIFDDDIQKRQDVESFVMLGQVFLIREDISTSRAWLGKALEIDPNHALAADLLKEREDRLSL